MVSKLFRCDCRSKKNSFVFSTDEYCFNGSPLLFADVYTVIDIERWRAGYRYINLLLQRLK